MRKYARYFTVTSLLTFLIIFGGAAQQDACETKPTADEIQSKRQENLNQEAAAQIGMPTIKNFRQAKLLKYIQELCDQELTTYVYAHSEMTGKFIYVGEALGFGVPYAAQLTNPEKITKNSQYGYGTLPQADPDQIFRPSSADGTWIMLKGPNGKVQPVLFEPKMVTSPFKLPDSVVQQ